MADSTCAACGAGTKQVVVPESDNEVVTLDRHPTWNGSYMLDPTNVNEAHPIPVPGRQGYNKHDCAR